MRRRTPSESRPRPCIVWLSGFMILSVRCQEEGPLVSVTGALRVARGAVAYVQPEDIAFRRVTLDAQCWIKVDVDSAGARLSAGEIDPKVFPCNFTRNSVRYVHNGNPLLSTDVVQLLVYYFDAVETVTQDLQLPIFIDSPDNLVFANISLLQPLVVENGSEFSNVIDSSVLRLRYSFSDESICSLTSYEPNHLSQSLLFGHLVSGDGTRLSSMTFDCREFLSSGLRYYKNNRVSTTTTTTTSSTTTTTTNSYDYVMLHAEVERPYDGIWRRTSENIFLPVRILGGSKNTPPKVSRLSESVLEVGQFALFILSPDVLWFVDAETPARNLVINVTKSMLIEKEDGGFFVHVYEPWQPIWSFLQDDVAKNHIAYRPTSGSLSSKRAVELKFTAVDRHFLVSDPVSLHVDVLPEKATTPFIAHKGSLTVLRSKSCALTGKVLRIIDSDNIDEVELRVQGGPNHGTLSVSGYSGSSSFKITDMERHGVVYKHDGGTSVEDKIVLTITDGKGTVGALISIAVFQDEEAHQKQPQLVTNRSLDVSSDRYVGITTYHLSARHPSLSDAEIIFNITAFPVHGQILKLQHPLSSGHPLSAFSQRDLDRGLVWFHRTSSENFDGVDGFQFRLHGANDLSAGTTAPLHAYEMRLKSFAINQPPRLTTTTGPAAVHLQLDESSIARITKDMLSYKDPEHPKDTSVIYTVTCAPYFIGNSLTVDAGRIVIVDHATTLTKRSNYPTVYNFTQSTIDRRMMAYVPPKEDIGATSVNVQFMYAVSDRLGNTVRNQRFNITVLPVNNQVPQVSVKPLSIQEGETLSLNSSVVAISDVDTILSELVLRLAQTPKYGRVFKNEREMTKNEKFGVDDLDKSSLRYVHDGSQTAADGLVFSVSDGKHTVSKSIHITIVPSLPSLRQHAFVYRVTIRVDEGREVTIGSQDLRDPSSTDSGNEDPGLTYEIVRPPHLGDFRVDGRPSDRFGGRELAAGSVSYRHTGGEIGLESATDSAVFMIGGGGQEPRRSSNHTLVEVSLVVSPDDNVPPQLMLGRPLVVEQGGAAPLTSAVITARDLDSSDSALTFVVFRKPVWGSLVKASIARSKRRSPGHSVSSFTMTELREGAIQYVQTYAPDGQPQSDSFFVFATDGKQNSSLGRVEVAFARSSNGAAAPAMFAFEVDDDFAVDRGGRKVFGVRMNHTEVERLGSDPVLSLAQSPRNGRVILVTQQNKETTFQEIPVSKIPSGVHLVYQHDGSETTSDLFALDLLTGSTSVQRTVHVKVKSTEDNARPRIVRNEAIRVKFGSTKIIDNEYLSVVDADGQTRLILVTQPLKGILELEHWNSTNRIWKKLGTGMSFSQADIDSNRLRYTHTKSLDRLWKDSFTFELMMSDGRNAVSQETFEIEILEPDSETRVIHNNGMTVDAGTSTVITSDDLSAIDSAANSHDVQYFVTRSPSAGVVEIDRLGGAAGHRIPVTSFSQSDLDRSVVFYNHFLNSSATNDSFEFSIRGRRNEAISSGIFRIRINQTMSVSPVVEVNVPLMVTQGSRAPITRSNLKMSGHEATATDLVYTVFRPPRYGSLVLINDAVVNNFTQNDVDAAKVFYRSESSDEMMDHFLFSISSHSTAKENQMKPGELKPQFFNILIQPMSRIAPTVRTVRPLTDLVPLSDGRQGFVLTEAHLHSNHTLFGADDLVYNIRERSHSGQFENRGTRRVVRKRFTQKDVDDRLVVFVINSDAQMTNDSVILKVTDPNRNAVDNVRLEMRWTLIEWSQLYYIVCEDVQLLSLVLLRRGSTIDHPASVHVRAKPMTARERQDYVPRSNATVTFAAGISKVNWVVEIVNDRMREGREEKFKVVLRNATGAILGPTNRTIIQIIDNEDGHCAAYRRDSYFPETKNVPKHNTNQESSSTDSSETGDPVEWESRHRITGSGNYPSSNVGFERNLQTIEPRKLNRSINRDRSTANQNSRNEVNITQPCSQDTKGLIYLDSRSSRMFRCSDGSRWEPWTLGEDGDNGAPPVVKDSGEEAQGGEVPSRRESVISAGHEDVQKTTCSSGWAPYNDSCFMAIGGRLTWLRAQDACRRDGGHLTHVKSRDHLVWLWNLNDRSQFWTGMHRISEGSPWKFADSTVPHYFNWRANHPCTRCRHSDCIAIDGRMEFVNKPCNKVKMKFVCVRSLRVRKRSSTRQ